MKALISLIQPAFDWTWKNSLQVALLVGLVLLVQTRLVSPSPYKRKLISPASKSPLGQRLPAMGAYGVEGE